MKKTLLAITLLLSAACAREIVTTVPFDPSEVSFINQTGSGQISGQAFLRQNGGGVVTCAGQDVTLVPAGAFARERITAIYGNMNGGRINVFQSANQEGVDPQYFALMRTTSCDAEGDYEFNGLAAGAYYVTTSVLWTVPGQFVPEGGAMSKLVQLGSGESKRVLLN